MDISESVNPRVIRLNGYRQFCELLSLILLIIGVGGFMLITEVSRWWWIAGSMLFSLVFLMVAFDLGRRAILEFVEAEFFISPQLLLTLQSLRAPKDLRQCLGALPQTSYRGEQEYFSELSTLLTPARCEELKSIIFKYTYAGRKK